MKKIILLSLIVGTMLFSEEAYSPLDELLPEKMGVTLGGGYGYQDAESTKHYSEIVEDSASFNSFFLMADYDFNEYIGVQGRYWFGIKK